MTNLIGQIGALRGEINVSADLQAQSDALAAIVAVVRSLRDGPPDLHTLTDAIAAVPLPPTVEALGSLPAMLPDVLARRPSDPLSLVGPLVAPLRALAEGGFSVSATIDIGALLEAVREIVRLTTGQVFAGPAGMPGTGDTSPQAFAMPDPPAIAELRAVVANGRAALGALGPRLDAPRLLALLRQAGAGAGARHPRMPPLPVLSDLLEALGTVAAWQAMPPADLARGLAATLHNAARLIAQPRDRTVAPLLDAANRVAGAQAVMTGAADALEAMLPRLTQRLAAGTATPSAAEATVLERVADALEPLAAALNPVGSPLARVADLSFDVTGHLLRAQRALSGAGDAGTVIARAEEVIASIPAPPTEPFGPAVDAINSLDIAALTGPIQALNDAVQTALDGVAAARAGVRDALSAALTPMADALDSLIEATRLEEAVPGLADFAGRLETEINTTVRPAVSAVRGAVEAAVDVVANATETFDPAALVEPLRDALDRLAAMLDDPELQSAFARVGAALEAATSALEGVNLSGAADEAIGNIEVIETKLAEIDPAAIPDPLKPAIAQAVAVVTDIDFSVTVSAPLVDSLGVALAVGPGALLGTLEDGIERLRAELDAFRPSVVIGAAIDEPFRELAETLHTFTPSTLLGQVQHALDGLAARAGVLDPGALLGPLADAHRSLTEAIATLSPAMLLRPINEQADRAVQRLVSETRLDSAFAGIAEFAAAIEAPLELLADVRDLLRDAAGLLADPGDAMDAVNAMIDETVARLDTIDMATLASGFAATAGAIAAIQRDAIVAPLAPALRAAAAAAPVALANPGARLIRLLSSVPRDALERARDTPATRRARAAAERLKAIGQILAAANAGWPALSQRLAVQANELGERLADYQRLLLVEGGGAFEGLAGPPAPDHAALQASVRAALQEEVAPVLRALHAGFRALAPWAAALAQGIADLLDAARVKLDAVLGNAGLGGAAESLTELGERLTNLDLAEVQAPLQALHTRLETAVARLDPAPIQAAIRDAAAAVTGLLNVEALVPASTMRTADQAWAAAVAKIDALSPEEVIAETLDPAWEHALGALAPALELPLRLRAILDAASGVLNADAKLQLARVEEAFDRMLRAIPLRTGVQSASVSVSVSVGG